MATSVFKFQHPKLPGEDLYFIQNTFFELPDTIPMDLASFIWYHFEINRTLEGFIFAWQNLCNNQTTLDGFSFDKHFEASEKEQLYQDALFNNALVMAQHNSDVSNQIHTMLNQNATEKELFQLINEAEELWVLDASSYESRHQLMLFLWDNYPEKLDEQNSYKKDKDIITELVQFSGLGLVFADDLLKRDISLLSSAASADYRAWFFIPKDLHEEVKNQINAEQNNNHFIVEHSKNEDEEVDDETIKEIMSVISGIPTSSDDEKTHPVNTFQEYENLDNLPQEENIDKSKDTNNNDDLPF